MKLAYALALAATATAPVAMAPAALAQEAKQLRFNDLDLDTPAGKAKLHARINVIAHDMCREQVSTGTHLAGAACMAQVRNEALAKVEEYQNRVGKGG